MKRVVTITARNGSSIGLEIVATISADATELARHEINMAATELADKIMSVIPGIRYVGIPMSKLRVRA
jgi:hypothetical protein